MKVLLRLLLVLTAPVWVTVLSAVFIFCLLLSLIFIGVVSVSMYVKNGDFALRKGSWARMLIDVLEGR